MCLLRVSTSIISVSTCSNGGVHETASFGENDGFRGVCKRSGSLGTIEEVFGLDAITFVSPNSIDFCSLLRDGRVILICALAVTVFSTCATAGESLTRFLRPASSIDVALFVPDFWTLLLVVAFGAGLRALGAAGVGISSSLEGTSNTSDLVGGMAEGEGLFLGLFNLTGSGDMGESASSSLEGTSKTSAFADGATVGDGLFLGLFNLMGSDGARLEDLDVIGVIFFSGDGDWRKRTKLCSGTRFRTAFPYVAILFL